VVSIFFAKVASALSRLPRDNAAKPGGPRLSLVRIVALPHTLVAATRLDAGTAKHTTGTFVARAWAVRVDAQSA
jgi:hypothetical protein